LELDDGVLDVEAGVLGEGLGNDEEGLGESLDCEEESGAMLESTIV
jgi:hypothetical protein